MTLLQYAFLTEPAVLQAGTAARLTLSVSNGGHARATCSSITVTLPVGTNAKDLVATTAGIGTVTPANWTAALDGSVITLKPATPDAGVIGGQGLAFVFTGLAVNAQPGICTVEIGETATNSTAPPVARTTTLPLDKFPAGFALTGPTANPLGVGNAGSTTIMWTGTPATYTLSYDPDGNGVRDFPVGNVGPYTAGPLTNAAGVVFTLAVEVDVPGSDQPLTLQPQVYVGVSNPTPAITTFAGAFNGPFGPALEATLSWTTSGRDIECTMSGNSQLLAPSGWLTVSPNGATQSSYTLSASNVNGTTSSTITITWSRPPTTIALPDGPVNAALSPDGTIAYVACPYGLYAVDLAAAAVRASLQWSNLLTVNVLPGGTRLIISDGSQVVVLDAATLKTLPYSGNHWGVPLASPAPYPTGAALSADGTRCFAPGPGNGATIYTVGPPPNFVDTFFTTAQSPLAIVTSPDGKTLLSAGQGSVMLTDAVSGNQLKTLGAPPNAQFTSVAFHPSGASAYALASSATDGSKILTAIDIATFSATASITYGAGTPAWAAGVAVTPDGAYVLSGGVGAVTVATSSLRASGTLPALDGAATTDIRVLPDGSAAVVCSSAAKALAIVPLPAIAGGLS